MHELLFALPLAYAAADRLWGASKPAFKGKKAVIAALVLGAGWLCGSWAGMAFGALWLVYRALPFVAGSGAPQKTSERLAAVLRHGLVVPPALLIAQQFHLSWLHVGAGFAAYAVIAASMAIAYGLRVIAARKAGEGIGRENELVEILRGLSYGLACIISVYF